MNVETGAFFIRKGNKNMKNYEKPVVVVNEGLAEGVYAASGSVRAIGDDGCWQVDVSFTAHADHCEVQIACVHPNPNPTHASSITVEIVFNKSVMYNDKEVGSVLTLVGGPGTSNSNENVTWNIQVYAADGNNAGVSIVSATYDCAGL